MPVLKIHYFLFLAVFMLAVKPLVGFHALKILQEENTTQICAKAFTKRKQEFVEDGVFDVSTIQKRLANPLLPLTVLFSILLSTFFPLIFRKAQSVTAGILSAIHLSLFPPAHRYLLSGKLTI